MRWARIARSVRAERKAPRPIAAVTSRRLLAFGLRSNLIQTLSSLGGRAGHGRPDLLRRRSNRVSRGEAGADRLAGRGAQTATDGVHQTYSEARSEAKTEKCKN